MRRCANPFRPAAAHLYDRPLRAVPGLQAAATASKARLQAIEGMVPPPWALPKGCAFAPRCASAFARCHEEVPVLSVAETGHHVACWAEGALHG